MDSENEPPGQDQELWLYGDLQKTGFQSEQMIENSTAPCHIGAVLLDRDCLEIETDPLALLPNEKAGTMWCRHQLNCKQIPRAMEVGLPLERYTPNEESTYHYLKFWRVIRDSQEYHEDKACSGVIGPGSLWIEYVEGFTNPKDWYISKVLGAAYENRHKLATLKYIFVDNVADQDAQEFCLTQLFTERNGLCWPPPENKVYLWRLSTAEFRALLGTPIGRVVASLVLCAYGQGVRRNCFNCRLSDTINGFMYEHALRS